MKEFNDFKSMMLAGVDTNILKEVAYLILNDQEYDLDLNEPEKIKSSDFIIAAESSKIFEDYLGGKLYICETEEDLKEICSLDLDWADKYKVWPNVIDKPLGWDICEYCLHVESTGWFKFSVFWSDTGGSIYYVPKKLWKIARVKEHLEYNTATWG